MPTFLQMVNNLFLNLRDEQISSFGDTDRTMAAKKLINEAAREVIENHEWSFCIRDDEMVYFPPKVTGLNGAVINNNANGTLRMGVSPELVFYTGTRRAKLMFPNDSSYGNVSYPVLNFDSTANQPFTLSVGYRGATDTSADFTLYSHEAVLPTSVRQVLSVRNEEGPVRIEPVEKHIEFDTLVPRVTDSFHDKPYVVYVGGTLETTSLNSTSKVYQPALVAWPPPEDGFVLKYSYIRRADTLSAEEDTLQGVPVEITDIIEWVAFQKALMGNMEDDPKRGETLFKQNEYRIRQARGKDRPAVMRRRYMRPHGGGPGIRHPNARWETGEVPTP